MKTPIYIILTFAILLLGCQNAESGKEGAEDDELVDNSQRKYSVEVNKDSTDEEFTKIIFYFNNSIIGSDSFQTWKGTFDWELTDIEDDGTKEVKLIFGTNGFNVVYYQVNENSILKKNPKHLIHELSHIQGEIYCDYYAEECSGDNFVSRLLEYKNNEFNVLSTIYFVDCENQYATKINLNGLEEKIEFDILKSRDYLTYWKLNMSNIRYIK